MDSITPVPVSTQENRPTDHGPVPQPDPRDTRGADRAIAFPPGETGPGCSSAEVAPARAPVPTAAGRFASFMPAAIELSAGSPPQAPTGDISTRSGSPAAAVGVRPPPHSLYFGGVPSP